MDAAAMDAVRETPAGSSPSTSPRISFSHHLSHKDDSFSSSAGAGDHPYRSESDSDFHFCNIETQTVTSSADEIFSNGFLLPLQQKPQSSGSSSSPCKDDQILKEGAEQVKSQSRPFWCIRRSSSLHCDNSQKRGSSWSFHSLPRSSSTGSKQTKKEMNHQRLKTGSSSSPSSSVHFYEFPLSSQKPPLRNNHGNGAVRINPVLNVPPPSCISMGNTNLFGLGSLFKTGKDKKMIKK